MKPLPLRVPELVPGLDVRKLPLSAIEGFVLSRVDGRAALTEIVAMTGLGIDQVAPIVEKLVSLGAVRWTGDAEAKPGPGPTSPAGPARAAPAGAKPVVGSAPATSARPAAVTNPPFSAGPPSGAPTGSRARVPSFPSLPPTPTSARSTPASGARPPSSPSEHPATGSRPPSSASHPPAGTARRRMQSGQSGPPRRVMAESTISQAPPDLRVSQRPGSGAPPSRPPSKRPPEATSKAPAAGATVDPIKALFDAVEQEEQVAQGEVSDRPPQPEAKVAMNPGPPSQPPVLTAAMLDVDLPYDPTELMEEVDLPVERRKEVLDLYYRLEHLDHYEILGIAYDADKKDVRAAYFSLSKVFHPDTMFRKNLGSFKAKMELVFSRLTEAYDTLGKKKARDEYDRYLQATKRTQMAERALVFETRREEARVAKAQVQVEVPQVSLPPPVAAPSPAAPAAPAQPSMPAREISDESRRLAQQIMQRRLRGVVGPPPKSPASPAQSGMQSASKPPPAPSTPPGTRTDPQELLRRLTRTLKDVGAVTGTSDQLTRHVKASQAAFARGDVAEAAKLMQRAVSIAPEREDLRAEFDKLSKMLSEKLAAAYEEQARFEQKANKWASAALSWVKVCEGRPQDANAHRMAAQALFKAGGDLRGAQKYAQQAVFLAPDDIEGHLLLAQLYLTIGLKLNAKRELDAATKLDPGNEMVKNLLADMKG